MTAARPPHLAGYGAGASAVRFFLAPAFNYRRRRNGLGSAGARYTNAHRGVLTMERHDAVLTVAELATSLRLETHIIRRLFAHEPGVVVISSGLPTRRVYRTLRIPPDVVLRVDTPHRSIPVATGRPESARVYGR